jgi:hypothetical protein
MKHFFPFFLKKLSLAVSFLFALFFNVNNTQAYQQKSENKEW